MAVNFNESEILKELNKKLTDRNIKFTIAVLHAIEDGEYVPRRSGDLESSRVIVHDDEGNATVTWNEAYAKRMFYGLETWNWTTAFNAKAGPHWTRPVFNDRELIDKLLKKNFKGRGGS